MRTSSALMGVLLGVAVCSAAQAGLSSTVTLVSDYVFRGVSQTDEDPTPQVSLDWYNDTGWYAGAWASDVDFGLDDSYEVDFYGGYAGALGATGWEYDIGLNYYSYPGSDDLENYAELLLGMSWDWFKLQFGYTPDNFGLDEAGYYVNVGGQWPLPNEFSLHASGGYFLFDEEDRQFFPGAPDSYVDWIVGVSRSWNGFDFSLDYMDTTDDAAELFGEDVSDGRLVLSISRTFTFIE